jgi:mRNA interferase RelE/StbE
MAKYNIQIKKSATKEIEKLPRQMRVRIIDRIATLAIDPRPADALKLTNSEKYRIRLGAYRILYTIEDDVLTVTVVKIGHRKDVYR